MLDDVLRHLDQARDTVLELQRRLVAIPAIGPTSGGLGEREKTDYLLDYLRGIGVTDLTAIDAPDPRVPCGVRPNVAAKIPGRHAAKTLWVISHTDIVPPGDRSLWDGDPFVLRVEEDRLCGRGVEDNHQGIVPGLLVAKALRETGTIPPISLGLLLLSDEETGSKFGLDYVLRTRLDLFSREDLFLVPDFGGPDASLVEVAEKSLFWLKISVHGKQCHGSTPQLGKNTLVASAALIMRLRSLYEVYGKSDPLFAPPCSTFEPTKKEANVPNVNTIPGLDVFYMDCRVLADYDLDDVLRTVAALGREIERQYGVEIACEVVQREQATPATDPGSEVVVRLREAIRRVYGVEARPTGIGGGTVAAFLRRKGFPAAVWCTWTHSAHQPNEWTFVSSQLGDAKVIARLLLDHA